MAVWEAAPIANWIVNSLVLVALGLFGQTFVSILVAFGFARTQFPGRNQLFVVVLATLMLPHQMMTVPWYAMFRTVGLLDSLWSVALPDLWGNAFYIFIFRQFFLTIPVELDEAAEIDGANLLQVLFRVVIPLSRPAIATVAVFNIVAKWNQFFWPFVFVQTPEKLTLPVGIRWFRTQRNRISHADGADRHLDGADHDLLFHCAKVFRSRCRAGRHQAVARLDAAGHGVAGRWTARRLQRNAAYRHTRRTGPARLDLRCAYSWPPALPVTRTWKTR